MSSKHYLLPFMIHGSSHQAASEFARVFEDSGGVLLFPDYFNVHHPVLLSSHFDVN